MLDRALKAGATDAETVVYEGDEFGVKVRLGHVETLKESGSRAVGLRVFIGQRTASTSSSDFAPDSLDRLVSGAVTLARITSEDPFAGLSLRTPPAFGQHDPADQHLYFDDVNQQAPADRIEVARICEAAALAYDPRIQNSGGGDFDTATSHKILMNSRRLHRRSSTERPYCGFSAQPIAHDENGNMQRNYWYSSSRTTHLLEDAVSIGQEAARRCTLRRLGARRVPTQQAPVVFAPEVARGIIGNIFDAANGDAIYRHATFFDGKLGERVAGDNVTVIDDGTLVRSALIDLNRLYGGDSAGTYPYEGGVDPGLDPAQVIDGNDTGSIRIGGFGTSPFDGEGLPTRRAPSSSKNGILKNYVMNTYTARKLGLASTGNASRSLSVEPRHRRRRTSISRPASSLPSRSSPACSQRPLRHRGSHAASPASNLVTGDYSQGAAGLWIENGELAYPVEEITIAGNLKDMYQNITAIGNDLVFRSAAAAPTLRIDGMTIAGS